MQYPQQGTLGEGCIRRQFMLTYLCNFCKNLKLIQIKFILDNGTIMFLGMKYKCLPIVLHHINKNIVNKFLEYFKNTRGTIVPSLWGPATGQLWDSSS